MLAIATISWGCWSNQGLVGGETVLVFGGELRGTQGIPMKVNYSEQEADILCVSEMPNVYQMQSRAQLGEIDGIELVWDPNSNEVKVNDVILAYTPATGLDVGARTEVGVIGDDGFNKPIEFSIQGHNPPTEFTVTIDPGC